MIIELVSLEKRKLEKGCRWSNEQARKYFSRDEFDAILSQLIECGLRNQHRKFFVFATVTVSRYTINVSFDTVKYQSFKIYICRRLNVTKEKEVVLIFCFIAYSVLQANFAFDVSNFILLQIEECKCLSKK